MARLGGGRCSIVGGGGLIAPGQGGLRTPPCTPLYFGMRGVHASLFEVSPPACPLFWGMHASKRRAYAQRACTPPQRGVHSLHALPEGRAPASHASLQAWGLAHVIACQAVNYVSLAGCSSNRVWSYTPQEGKKKEKKTPNGRTNPARLT